MATAALLASIGHPSEVYALLKYKFTTSDAVTKYTTRESVTAKKGTPEYTYQMCYYFLNKTSRSFARVIQELHPELAHPRLGHNRRRYDLSNDRKLPLLRTFDTIMYKKGWTFNENGPNEKDRILMVEFDVVIDQFLRLKESYQTVIADVTRRMVTVVTIADYDLYTHYVAGLVGIGLTGLFSVSGLEDASLTKDEYLQNRMGLFLQKVNIMKDYLEDLNEGRQFWPEEVWSKYVWENQGLDALAKPENLNDALACLNELCVNAMELAPDCLEYMSKLKEPSVIHFCAIPQVMAIASIALFFNNSVVFTKGGLKIRRGLAVKLIYEGTTFEGVKNVFKRYALEIAKQNSKRVGTNPKDESFMPMSIACSKVIRWINAHDKKMGIVPKSSGEQVFEYLIVAVNFVLLALIVQHFYNAYNSLN
ncbi:farnesyl-diphosphate farnesyltransferase [Rhizoclosmatium globosum]|uniref:Farnesyl-diphosphate farnesyltransferase n=1 Tax=Rhizoclosmatium globosum TaxID=329046 RepID=A0A1Y2CH81_9FUNG|nr:farnesyl-diphosphate farnesyltransferase [Rhizoclosmatium globosum]|eukprot:ORY46410.1 farnesyl-diphosphate farnesyltransferase [Rhizoclosmatium globosum]